MLRFSTADVEHSVQQFQKQHPDGGRKSRLSQDFLVLKKFRKNILDSHKLLGYDS